MERGAVSRRESFGLFAVGMLALVTATPALGAGPVDFKLYTKKYSTQTRVKIYMSTHLGPFNFSNRYIGTYYVPNGGSKTVNVNVMAGLFAIFKMSIQQHNQDKLYFEGKIKAGALEAKKALSKVI
jgi:hypothetical protein